MTETVLYTNDDRIVVSVQTPPWVRPPELLIWGERFFLLREDGTYTEASGSFFIPPPIQDEPAPDAG